MMAEAKANRPAGEVRLEAEAHAGLPQLGRRGADAARLHRVGRDPRGRAQEERARLHQHRWQRPRVPRRRGQPFTGELRGEGRERGHRSADRRLGGRPSSRRRDDLQRRRGGERTREGDRQGRRRAVQGLPARPARIGLGLLGFLQHLGIAALNVGYGGEGNGGGVYHSAYDTWEHHSKFVDPGFAYAGALAKTTGRLVLRMSETELPVQRYADFANTVSTYVDEVKKLADRMRDEQTAQAKLFATNAFKLSDDPTLSSGLPTRLKAVPYFNFAPIENAVTRVKAGAKAYDTALAAKGTALPAAKESQAGRARRADRAGAGDGARPARRARLVQEHDLRARPSHPPAMARRRCRASARRSRMSAGRMSTRTPP